MAGGVGAPGMASGPGIAPPRVASAPRPLAWRLLRDAPLPGARNMALDHALALCLRPGEAVLRLYGWSRPTISFGRNEPAGRPYRGAAGVDHVRRPTGGRSVAHGRELTYAVVAPLDAWGGARAAYAAINEALAAALAGLGVRATLAPEAAGRALRPDEGPCFRAPAPGEVVAEGRKLIGSAQARVERALLQHGSILVEDDQGLLGGPGSGSRPATLRELAGDVSIDALAAVVAMSLRETFGGTWIVGEYRPAELEAAERLERERYAHGPWTWRR